MNGRQPAVSAVRRAVAAHRERWGAPSIVVRAPGRVNLIGDHTDYNDGFALPMALPFDTVVALSDAAPPGVEVVAAGFGELHLEPAADPRTAPPWARHIAGVITLLAETGIAAAGWRATVDTDIPIGAGLSSSAALEVAMAVALTERAGVHWSPIELARLGQRVEHEVVGLPSGIMDQLISAGATAGHASLLDCRAVTLVPVALPPDVVVAVIDTGTRRVLADGAYADRRAACERAAGVLGIAALRDATPSDVARIADAVDRRRARHVVTENERVLAAVDAARRNDAAALGALMVDSHRSLRDDFEVSAPALDRVVDIAMATDGCLGARMTGGGFAGCAVALVHREAAEGFAASVTRATADRAPDGVAGGTVWICEPAAGASSVTSGV